MKKSRYWLAFIVHTRICPRAYVCRQSKLNLSAIARGGDRAAPKKLAGFFAGLFVSIGPEMSRLVPICFQSDAACWQLSKIENAWIQRDFASARMAIPAGLEPATRGVEIRYSIQLSYGTVRRRRSTARSGPRRLAYHRYMKILLVRQDHPNRIRSCRDKARRGGVTPYSSRGGSPGTAGHRRRLLERHAR
jgi:hypothetical protein